MVSVIIPNYNHAVYLKQRIDSVLNQTYQHFELIILDDCSADNSREVIESYRTHPKVSHIIFNEVNSGSTFKQWKKGIELAKGEYIWIAESDDWCETTLLDTLVAGMEQNPSCVLGYVQTYVVNGDKIERTSTHNKMSECVNGKNYIFKYLIAECTIWNASMMIFKRDCYFQIPQDFTTFKLSGDWLFYIQLALLGDVYISGKVLNYFRNHERDVSGGMYSSGKNYLEELRILEILKNEAIISQEQFKMHLLSKYLRFKAARYRFTPEITGDIKQAFLKIDNGSQKASLGFAGWVEFLKIKMVRRLSIILSVNQ